MAVMRTKRILCVAVVVSGLFLAWVVTPANGLSIRRYAGCGDLCYARNWIRYSAKDVAAALDRNPAVHGYKRTMIRLAVNAGNIPATEALLRTGAPPNAREETGEDDYILHEAARRNAKLVSLLLKAGSFPGVVGKGARTPLHEAVRWGRPGAVALLLEAGADPRAPDGDGLTAIDLARRHDDHENSNLSSERHRPPLPPPCRNCRDKLLDLLLAPPLASPPCGLLCETQFWKIASREQVRRALAQAPVATSWSAPGGGPLHHALAAGADVETVKLLLDHGIAPNRRNIRDDTPLHVAARTPGGDGSVRLLLERGAMLDALNARDWTPLHAASERASTLDAMRVLLDAGANPDIRAGRIFGVTPLHLAVSQTEGPKAAELILGYRGTSPHIPLRSLLHAAAERGRAATVEFLLSQGAKAHAPNIFGKTALHAAAGSGNIEAMRVLLWHGAEPDYSKYDAGSAIFSGVGERPLHEAVPHPVAVRLLLEAGADLNGKTLTGGTPLHFAARTCAGASLALLLDRGVDPSVRDKYNRTPLHEAVWRVVRSRKSNRGRQYGLALCEKAEKEKKPLWGECLVFKNRYEAREECTANIATLIKSGADPGIRVSYDIRSIEWHEFRGMTPYDMALQYSLGDSIIGLMKGALIRDNR